MKNNKQFGLTDSLLDAVRQVVEKKLDPVGQADADIDNDGDVDSSDKYLHRRRKAIKKAMATKEAMQMKRSKSDKDLAKEIEAYAKKHGGIDKASFMKVAQMLSKGQRLNAIKFAKKLDTDPRDWVLDKLGEASMKEEVEQVDEAPYTHRAATFNGNVVKGTGSTKEAARKDAEKKAKEIGSSIRKQLPTKEEVEQTDEGAMSRMDVQTKEKERLGSDKVRGSGLKTFKKKDEVDVKPKMAEASELPKKVIMKGHEIAKKLIKMKSKVDEPYAVGMATAKKKYGID